jgi:hypothetical protein
MKQVMASSKKRPCKNCGTGSAKYILQILDGEGLEIDSIEVCAFCAKGAKWSLSLNGKILECE